MIAASSKDLDRFVASLARVRHRPDLYNPYRGPGGPARRANLVRYFSLMAARSPRYLLVGEAVGYRGGRMSGVPFTSETLLFEGLLDVPVLGTNCGYERATRPGPLWREATATIVWEALRESGTLPILWNALPFHPHRPAQRLSNRTPRAAELQLGSQFLPPLLALFPIKTIIAVGRRAETALAGLGLAYQPLRHPSHGGKEAFRAGLEEIFATD